MREGKKERDKGEKMCVHLVKFNGIHCHFMIHGNTSNGMHMHTVGPLPAEMMS